MRTTDHHPVPVSVTVYYRHDDGSVSQRTITATGGQEPGRQLPVPPGAEQIDQATYEALSAQIADLVQQERQRAVDAQAARQQADYQALRDVGLPEESARRLSGHTAPTEPELPELPDGGE